MSIEPYREGDSPSLQPEERNSESTGRGYLSALKSIFPWNESETEAETTTIAEYRLNTLREEGCQAITDLLCDTGRHGELGRKTGMSWEGLSDKIENGFSGSRYDGKLLIETEDPELDSYESYLRDLRSESTLEDTRDVFPRIQSKLEGDTAESEIRKYVPEISFTLEIDMKGVRDDVKSVSDTIPPDSEVYRVALRDFGYQLLDESVRETEPW